MLYTSSTYSKAKNFSSNNRVAFLGDSCYPMSPTNADGKDVEDEEPISLDDQLIKILRYNHLTKYDTSHLTNKN